jgi:MoaA/NifB/PqqE/SkfB family radical SAM enzyme
MPLNVFKQQVDFFYEGHCPHIHICAPGEPFLHDNILEMIDYVIDVYGEVSLQSNMNKVLYDKNNYLDEIIIRKKYISYLNLDVFSDEEGNFNNIKTGSSYNEYMNSIKLLSDSGIQLNGCYILSKSNIKYFPSMIETMIEHKIKMTINVASIIAHGFNDFTSKDNVVDTSDVYVKRLFHTLSIMAAKNGINIISSFPKPGGRNCNVLWDKIQIWPTKFSDPHRIYENLIPHACNAVVLGDISSLGYVSDYSSLYELWNNEIIVAMRSKLLNDMAIDKCCLDCIYGNGLH